MTGATGARSVVRRHGWWAFVLVAVTGIVPGVLLMAEPSALEALVTWFGHELPDGVVGSAGGDVLARWIGTVLLGANLFTLAIVAGPYRRRERWAWRVLWYWPATFVAHAMLYGEGARAPQLAWAVVTAAVLWVGRPVDPEPTPTRSVARSTSIA